MTQDNLINIPFMPEWEAKMLSGQKVCTSRNKKYGEVGERFSQFGATFEITEVRRLSLGDITKYYYKEEGCKSSEEFIKVWLKLHPRAAWMPGRKVYTHFFRRVE